VTAVAGAVLLPLGRATAKPSPVVTGAMPQASLDIEGDGEAEPSPDRDRRGRAPAAGPGDGEAEPGRDRGDAVGEPGHRGRGRS